MNIDRDNKIALGIVAVVTIWVLIRQFWRGE